MDQLWGYVIVVVLLVLQVLDVHSTKLGTSIENVEEMNPFMRPFVERKWFGALLILKILVVIPAIIGLIKGSWTSQSTVIWGFVAILYVLIVASNYGSYYRAIRTAK